MPWIITQDVSLYSVCLCVCIFYGTFSLSSQLSCHFSWFNVFSLIPLVFSLSCYFIPFFPIARTTGIEFQWFLPFSHHVRSSLSENTHHVMYSACTKRGSAKRDMAIRYHREWDWKSFLFISFSITEFSLGLTRRKSMKGRNVLCSLWSDELKLWELRRFSPGFPSSLQITSDQWWWQPFNKVKSEVKRSILSFSWQHEGAEKKSCYPTGTTT